MIDDAMAPLADAQAGGGGRARGTGQGPAGERGSGRKELEDRHKREARRYRSDELRFGLTELSRRYRDELATSARPAAGIEALEAIAELARELVRNPNERLQLLALFLTLGRISR